MGENRERERANEERGSGRKPAGRTEGREGKQRERFDVEDTDLRLIMHVQVLLNSCGITFPSGDQKV